MTLTTLLDAVRPSTHPWVKGALIGVGTWGFACFILLASAIAPGDNGVASNIPPKDDLFMLGSLLPLFVGGGSLISVLRHRRQPAVDHLDDSAD